MRNEEILVQIIILNWNGYELTKDCLNSLSRLDYQNYKVIVVDNGSTDGSYKKLVSEFPAIEFLAIEANLGFADGNNAAILHTREKYNPQLFLLLNNDTTVEPTFLRKMVDTFSSNPNAGILGNKIYYYEDPQRIWFAGGQFNKFLGDGIHLGIDQLDIGQFNDQKKIDFVTGCCMMISKDVINKIGLLDSSFFAYCEDLDYSLRASKAGYVITYVPDAIIYHKVSSSFKTKDKKQFGARSNLAYYLNVRNRLFIYRKHKERIKPLYFFIHQVKYVSRYLIGFFITLQFGKVKSVLQGLWDGVSKPMV